MKIEQGFSALGANEQRKKTQIEELKKRRDGITAFRDITLEDRRILEDIDKEIEVVKDEEKKNFEEEKGKLFAKIDIVEGAYSSTLDKDYSPEEIKDVIEDVLDGRKKLQEVPRSPIFGTEKDLRDLVKELQEL